MQRKKEQAIVYSSGINTNFYTIRTDLDNLLHNQIHLILHSVSGTNTNYCKPV